MLAARERGVAAREVFTFPLVQRKTLSKEAWRGLRDGANPSPSAVNLSKLMAELWQDVQARAQATYAVWDRFFTGLVIGATGQDDYNDATQALSALAQVRDNATQAVDQARQTHDLAFGTLRALALQVPKIIEGVVDEKSGLIDDLDKVYAIYPSTPAKAVSRGQALAPLWAAANAWQAAQTPTRPPIVRGTATQAIFVQKLQAFPVTKETVAAQELALDVARGDLRRGVAAVDRLNKRFLVAATGMVDPGSAAADALETIPTSSQSPLPDTLSIRTFAQGGAGGLQLVVTYEAYDWAEPGVDELVQWMVVGVDPGWDHAVPAVAGGNAFGPFTAGQTVRVRTKVTNGSGSREGGVRQLTIQAPPV